MKKFIIVCYLLILFLSQAPKASAATVYCKNIISGFSVAEGINETFYTGDKTSHNITLNAKTLDPSYKYYLQIRSRTQNTPGTAHPRGMYRGSDEQISNNQLSFSVSGKAVTNVLSFKTDYKHIYLFQKGKPGVDNLCYIGYYTLAAANYSCDRLDIIQERTVEGETKECYQTGCLQVNKPVKIRVSGFGDRDGPYSGNVRFVIGATGWDAVKDPIKQTSSAGAAEASITPQTYVNHSVLVKVKDKNKNTSSCKREFKISYTCGDDAASCGGPETVAPGGPVEFKLCDQISESDARDKCTDCINDRDGIWTAVGCIPAKPQNIIQTFIKIGLTIGGGVALLMILAGGFMLSVSQGDPKKAQDAKDRITSAIIGLIFIIFSITILQFIGVQIFRIPGFGT